MRSELITLCNVISWCFFHSQTVKSLLVFLCQYNFSFSEQPAALFFKRMRAPDLNAFQKEKGNFAWSAVFPTLSLF